jgi:hypothetical protein
MLRRHFLKVLPVSAFSFLALKLSGCGSETHPTSDSSSLAARFAALGNLRIWSYYVPLTSYQGIIEEFEGRNSLDRKVIFEQLSRQTSRINGRESDGTANPATLNVDALQNSEEYLRVRFWHDDNGNKSEAAGHSLYVFKRYLTDLEAGKKVFVATGIYQGHFHVVMIEPATAS